MRQTFDTFAEHNGFPWDTAEAQTNLTDGFSEANDPRLVPDTQFDHTSRNRDMSEIIYNVSDVLTHYQLSGHGLKST